MPLDQASSQQREQGFDGRRNGSGLQEHLEAIRRRITPMLLVSLLVLASATLAAWFWPPTYRSTGVILIEQQEVPENFVQSAVSSYADQRVQVIGQRVMTSTNLLGIARKFDLYPQEKKSMPREALLERMREDIRLEMISADVVDPRLGRATKATIAFSVGFDSPSPRLAAAVANELTSLYLSENLESRQQLAAGTASFLNDEAQKLGTRVGDLEKQIAKFKEEHSTALPELGEINIQLMNRTEDDLRDLDARARLLDQQIVFLDAQLAQITPSSLYASEGGQRILSPADRLKMARSEYASALGVYSESHPTVRRLKLEIESLEKQTTGVDAANDINRALTQARGELAEARERYSPEHPDIIALERRIAALEDQARSAPRAAVTASRPEVADNPAYIQLQSQRQAAVGERESLIAEKEQLKARLRDFETRLSQAPGVERDYSALMRELDNERHKYAEVRQKQMEAQLASNMETERKGERFTLIEPPLVPDEPVSPNRRAILAIGVILSMVAAFALMMGLEAIDTRIRGRRGVIALLDVPPLAVIPWVTARKRA